jgi:hypothetical protein
MPLTLYKIQDYYRQLMAQLDECEGELTPELAAALDINEAEWEEKAVAYRCILRELAAEGAALVEESRRMRQMAERIDRKMEQLKQRLLEAVKERGGKAKAGPYSFWEAPTVSVEFDGNAFKLPPDCSKITADPVKTRIKEILQGDDEDAKQRLTDAGCKLVERTHLGMR